MKNYTQSPFHTQNPFPIQARNLGFTLIEFMVASALALVVLLAIGVTYGITSNMRNASENRLAAQQDLRNASELLLRDAQMAGSFGCFNMGNLLNKQMINQSGSGTGFRSSETGLRLVLNDADYSGISIMPANTAANVLKVAGFDPSRNSPVLVFVYGQHITPITGTQNFAANNVSQELRNTAAGGGPIALSSCSRMYIGTVNSNNGLRQNGNNINIDNSFTGGTVTSTFSDPSVFYLPQTTISQVTGVAYAVGRTPADTSDALYRFTLTPGGRWGNPQLMAANIANISVDQLYAGCSNNSSAVTFSNSRTDLGNLNVSRISMLPTVIEVRLQLTDNQRTYGSMTQYLIRANVRGGNICANQS